jgi:hypothetical protein
MWAIHLLEIKRDRGLPEEEVVSLPSLSLLPYPEVQAVCTCNTLVNFYLSSHVNILHSHCYATSDLAFVGSRLSQSNAKSNAEKRPKILTTKYKLFILEIKEGHSHSYYPF